MVADRGGEPVSTWTLLSSIRSIVLPYLLSVFVVAFHNNMPQYILRTYVSCSMILGLDGNITANDPRSSDWSGSDFCNDQCYVFEEAAFRNSILVAVDNSVQFLFYPVLGSGVDWYGRRW
jgi:hypothetical protein